MYYRSLPAEAFGGKLKHWQSSKDKDGIVWLYADRAGESANSMSQDMMQELYDVLQQAESEKAKGVAILSAKKTGFIHGADIREFSAFETEGEVAEALEQGHKLFDYIADCPLYIVAAIDGICLGGGLELALCCDYRIATDSPSTKLGLPEVKLGIQPGLGGSARLTALIGGKDALPLMMTGKMVRAGAARGLGIVDKLVKPHESLEWAARDAIFKKRKGKGPSFTQRMSNSGIARKLLAPMMEKQVASKARRDHYPAPFMMIEQYKDCGGDVRKSLNREKENFAELLVSPTSKGLRRVFHLMDRMKGIGKVAEKKKMKPIRRIHVIGAGVMGADIAAWSALKGYEVTLQDLDQAVIDKGLASAKKLFKRRIRNKAEAKSAELRLRGDKDGKGVERADLIIEAIVERLDVKKGLFAELEPRMKKDAILATNTSSIQLQDLEEGLKNPKRLVGIHFFNPVALMPLVEVIYTDKTQKNVIDRAAAYVAKIDKLPLPVKSAPGFLVNRVLAPYTNKAFEMSKQGHSKAALDKAAEVFGMPMGPFEVTDVVGLDTVANVARVLSGEVPPELQAFVDSGNLGKKTGEGNFVWKDGKPQKEDVDLSDARLLDLGKQMVAPMVEEVRRCVAEDIVEDDDLADAGVIFGCGFAPFRGGPINYDNNENAAA